MALFKKAAKEDSKEESLILMKDILLFRDRILVAGHPSYQQSLWSVNALEEVRERYGFDLLGESNSFLIYLNELQQQTAASLFEKAAEEKKAEEKLIAEEKKLAIESAREAAETAKTQQWISKHVTVLINDDKPARVDAEGLARCIRCDRPLRDTVGDFETLQERIKSKKAFSAAGSLFCGGCQGIFKYSIEVKH